LNLDVVGAVRLEPSLTIERSSNQETGSRRYSLARYGMKEVHKDNILFAQGKRSTV
jgi:hypothetical protein